MNDLIYVGYASMPFGLKGEIKILSDLNHLDKIFKEGNPLIIDNKEYIIIKSHFHKNNYMITFKNYEDINLINDLIKKDVYIKRSNINLTDDEYLYSDLYNSNVIYEEKKYGLVSNIMYNNKYVYIKCNDVIIPLIDKYIEKIDVVNKMIYVKNIRELEL